MTPQETVVLVRYVKALVPATQVDEYTPDAWQDVLGRWPLADCRAAAAAVAGRQTWISAGDIANEVRRIRAARLDGFEYEPTPGDDDPAVYLARRRQQLEAVADGRRPAALPPPPPAPALTGPRPPVDIRALVAGIGQTIPEDSP